MKSKWIFLLLTFPLWTFAQSEKEHFADEHVSSGSRVVNGTSAKMLGIGSSNMLDTYISPETYRGIDVRYISMTDRQSNRHKPLSYRTVHQGTFSYTHNRADNNNELGGLYNFQYAVHYNWSLFGNQLQVHAGGGLDVNAGFLYNTRNQNNPAQARLSLNLAPSAGARYELWAFKKHCHLNYDVQFPLVGVMFSPNYGQSYYEIFNEGNYDHNIVPTTIVSTPSFRHMLSFDFPVARTWLRIGYYGDYQQSKVNHLKYHHYAHMVVIGIVKNFSLTHLLP